MCPIAANATLMPILSSQRGRNEYAANANESREIMIWRRPAVFDSTIRAVSNFDYALGDLDHDEKASLVAPAAVAYGSG